ncbi:cysteine desulfurase (ISS) [Dorcoceras hygrometricum]|uniref:Cysteine desulfurase (ISS) n=1 Tax=Dorcoceras hygrometricum TaxID=472368 RepID=A0A2Z7AJI3_9LAMI|nr:cysteine desulfurase (ISS) [Dorcoceras hygrometricum]
MPNSLGLLVQDDEGIVLLVVDLIRRSTTANLCSVRNMFVPNSSGLLVQADEIPFVPNSSGLLVQDDEGIVLLVVDLIRRSTTANLCSVRNMFVPNSSGLLVQADVGIVLPVVDLIRRSTAINL